MKHKKLYITILKALLTVIIVFAAIIGILRLIVPPILEAGFYTEIKEGFSPNIVRELEKYCGIIIPEDAEFIKGIHINARDPAAVYVFSCPADYDEFNEDDGYQCVTKLLGLNKDQWSSFPMRNKDSFSDDHQEFIKRFSYDFGGELDFELDYKIKDFVTLRYEYSQEDNKIIFRLYIWTI